MPRRALALALLLAVWSALGASASAQTRSKDPPGYADAVKQGLTELEAGNYPEAREEFLRAHELFPNARTLRGLGMVEFELRNYAECVRRLEAALASEVKPLDANLRMETEALLERARRYLGELVLEVDPDTARVVIDGNAIEPAQRQRLLLEVGNHALEVHAPGYLSDKRSIRIQGSIKTELRVNLELPPAEEPTPLAAAAPLAPTSAPQRSERTPVYKKWWLWTVVGVVAAAGATTAALLLTRDKGGDETRPVTGSNAMGPTLYTLRSF
jgi:tetratricopeptide (TPR) repeat protein